MGNDASVNFCSNFYILYYLCKLTSVKKHSNIVWFVLFKHFHTFYFQAYVVTTYHTTHKKQIAKLFTICTLSKFFDFVWQSQRLNCLITFLCFKIHSFYSNLNQICSNINGLFKFQKIAHNQKHVSKLILHLKTMTQKQKTVLVCNYYFLTILLLYTQTPKT